MNITLDMARALDAFATAGTYEGAAKKLDKGHTSVVYALKQLERASGVTLFDRDGYRTRLTPAGERVLTTCKHLLAAERALLDTCTELRSGWEPQLRIVFDAVFPAEPVLHCIGVLRQAGAPTRVVVSADSLEGVERRFLDDDAEVMISVLPVSTPSLRVVRLPKLHARLVAHRKHPLGRHAGTLSEADVASHALLTVRGSDPRLQLSTSGLEARSTVLLPDFHAKKAAILAQLGFGWLPDWLTNKELAAGTLVALQLEHGSVHAFEPRAYFRAGRAGPATRVLLELLRAGGVAE